MKPLKEFKIPIDIHLNEYQIREALEALNLFYTGDKECGIWVDNTFESKYPEIEKANPNFQKSHYNANRSYITKVTVQLFEDGTLRLK